MKTKKKSISLSPKKFTVSIPKKAVKTISYEQDFYKWTKKQSDKSIENVRLQINMLLEDSPSLKQELKKEYENAYKYARKKASVGTGLDALTFQEKCPWKLEEIL